VLAKDWGRARAADHAWFAGCYDYGSSGSTSACRSALHRQISALQRLQRDVSAQHLAGTQLGAIVDGRFLHGVAAALVAKKLALGDLTTRQFPEYAAQRLNISQGPVFVKIGHIGPPLTPVRTPSFQRHDFDPVVCIEPVGAAIQNATGQSASHPLFRSYPLSNGWFPITGRGSCPAMPPVT
jgi:hypothetical protein